VHLNIVFIGHADARKSMMGGNLLYLCRMIDKRTMEKYEREAKEAGRETLVPPGRSTRRPKSGPRVRP
jgi:peptide chain release factor subunit 3